MNDQELEERLRRTYRIVVPVLVDAQPAAELDRAAAHSRQRHETPRTWTRAVAIVGAMAVIGAVVIVVSTNNSGKGSPSSTTVSTTIAPTTALTTQSATAAELKNFVWSNLPGAPIAVDDLLIGAATAWTGKEVIVWNGVDGAAFNPLRQTWRTIPSSKLVVPRTQAHAVWTGHEMVVIGGIKETDGSLATSDGAFNPDTDTWRVLSKRPHAESPVLAAIWTGGYVVTFSADGSGSFYFPDSDTWSLLARLPEDPARTIANVFPVVAGGHLLLWVEWQEWTPIVNGTSSGNRGIDLIAGGVGANYWTVQPVPTEFARGIAAAFWTGSDVVLAPTVFHGGASGPVPFNLRGVRYDPATGAYALMSHSAVNDSANATVWTGGSLVQFSWAQGGLSGSTPGDGQAWDPTTDTWFAVASAPFEGFGDQFVWTGSEIVAIGPGGGHQLAPAAHP